LSVSVDPVFDQNGELIHAVHVARDITDRKRAEEELRRSEVYLAEGQRLSGMGSWAWSADAAGRHYWSEEMFRIFGFKPKEGAPALENFLQRIHPEDYDRATKQWEQTLRDKTDLAVDFRTVLPDGTIRNIYIIGHPVLDETSKVVEYVGTAMDVTERKRAEDELRKHREHLEDLVKQRTEELAVLNQLVYGSLESGEVGALWIDFKEADTLHALDNTARMLGLEPDPTGEKTYKLSNWTNLLTDTAVAFPDYAPIIEEAKERLLGAISGKYKNYRAVYPTAMPDGSLKWIDGRAEVAKRGDYGQALLMTGTLIDITRLKRAEADLAEAKTRAEAANRAKSTFLANMSHELRTPLNAVLGFSRLLKNDPGVTPQQQETLDVIVRSGEHLLNLINNVLDMAKIESGRAVLKESEVDLNQLLHEMQSLMGVGAVEKGLRFALEHDPDLPRFVAVDAGKLRQVLLNLLGNAIKYTDSGGVKLRARLASLHGTEKAQVRFEVEDSGPGISQEDCQRIFFPFVQLGNQAPAQAGTGLGLAICKQYVELMGGQIGVASKPGKGSAFYFEIPVRVLPSVAERDELKPRRILGLAEGQPRHRLLIVEDQPENRLLLRRLLDPLGFELREAANGQEAVALFEQWHPDLIWMDIRMPVMDGLEAVRRIRATKAGADTKIVALTAHALEEEREPIMAAGCDDLVRKPFREQELFEALARHLRLKFIYETAPRQESTPEVPGLTLNPEQLDALPAQLLQELRQAVVELDTARTHALIEQVAERDASLGRALNTLATQFDYERLLKLLEREPSHPGQTL
jgi:PAS domain S-box-containing protein